MGDIKQQLEWVRDIRKKRLAVIISPLDAAERIIKTFHLTEIASAEKYAIRCSRFYPVRITDTKSMEVIRVYLMDSSLAYADTEDGL